MSVKFPADPNNLIELPGVGKVPRPTDLDQSKTGFKKLVSLRIYDFSAGQTIHGEAEGDEVIIVFLQGSLTVTVSGAQAETWEIAGREDVFSAAAQAVYLPPGYDYRLELQTNAQVAYARARAVGRFPPRLIEAVQVEGAGGAKVSTLLGPGEAEALECIETLLPGGSWYTTPEEHLRAERLTHYRLSAPHAVAFHHAEEDQETALCVRAGDTLVTETRSLMAVPPGQRLCTLTVFVRTT